MPARTSSRPTAASTETSGERINRRNHIIEAAGRLFRHKGFEATTVRDIAAACGMQGGSPFYHFASKVEILKAIMLKGVEDTGERLRQTIAEYRDADPATRLTAMVTVHLRDILDPEANFVPAILYEWRSLPPQLQAEVVAGKDTYEDLWKEALQHLHAEGAFPEADPTTRLLFLGMLNSVAQWYKPDGPLSIDEIATRIAAVWLHPSQSG